jgi:lysyl-tRNA synthetase class 1
MSREQIINALIRSKMIDSNITKEDIDYIIERIEISGEWIRKYANEKYKIKLLEKISIKEEISDEMKIALEELSKYIEIENDGEKIQAEIFSIAKKYDIKPSDFFKTIYNLFLGKNEGPRLGPFLAILDKKFVINRLKLIE